MRQEGVTPRGWQKVSGGSPGYRAKRHSQACFGEESGIMSVYGWKSKPRRYEVPRPPVNWMEGGSDLKCLRGAALSI